MVDGDVFLTMSVPTDKVFVEIDRTGGVSAEGSGLADRSQSDLVPQPARPVTDRSSTGG